MGLTLRPYQELAVGHLQHNPRAGLFLEMGLGKTAITLTALTPNHLPALVVAPKRVAENVWAEEVAIWRPDLSIAVAAGSPAQRARAFGQRADITVVSRDNLADAVKHARRMHWKTFILDELSSFKSWKSNRFKAARSLSRVIPVAWGLTGTPSPNNLLDLWSQMYLLDQGERLGQRLTHFRNRYFYPGNRLQSGIITEWIPRDEADTEIHKKLDDICLSMRNEGLVDLPPATFNPVKIPMDSKTRQVYRTMKDDLLVGVQLLGEVHTATTAAALSSRLSQISAGFIYPDTVDADGTPRDRDGSYTVIHWEKVRAIAEIVEGTGSPVLVFYHFLAEKEMILQELPRLGIPVHTMNEKDIVKRWNAGEVPVLLAHPASAGHGLNLQFGGHTAIWTTLPWSLEEWQQANARLPRSGQKHPVVTHLLMTKGGIDSHILKVLEHKETVQNALLAHLESPI